MIRQYIRGQLFAKELSSCCSLFSLTWLPLPSLATGLFLVLSPSETACTGSNLLSPERCQIPFASSSVRPLPQGCGTGTCSLLETWEKLLALLLLDPGCGFRKPRMEGAGVLQQASLQVPEAKRSSCGSLCEEDASWARDSLVAPLEHLPFALDYNFDSFTMEVPQQGQG